MLDIKFIRDNLTVVKEGARKKGIKVDLDRLVALDDERRTLTQEVNELRAQQKAESEGIQNADPTQRAQRLEALRALKERLQRSEERLQEVMREWRLLMLQVPNIPDVSVPEGESDADNVEVRQWGEPREFAFQPRSHIELLEMHRSADFERGAKVAGFRGYFLEDAMVRLSVALWQFVWDHFREHHPEYRLMMVPSLVRKEPFFGTGYLPQGEEDLYKTQDDLYLAGTAEVAMMGYFMDEVLDHDALPMKFLAFSPCFRREAGSHGKDTKGLVRVHEFYKLEQVILCEASHETSVRFHEELTANAEELLQALGLPYRVVVNCGGDLGLGQVKKYDIEAWVPSEGRYRETHSSSYFHDFQTRRLNIRYRDADGKMRYAHSLNNTALATPRMLVPLLENYQEADGSIVVPKALQPYMDAEVLRPRSTQKRA
ncbi:serine--tRNA ligase [Candidatus Parcubacteria bacterium]|nr:MAG: serine--tRNA ligase [Candidatus Parcubacteria bacterium]GIW69027.1 MAG: serine--tRNA ligase [Candidatus Parcubacteria bacterium]